MDPLGMVVPSQSGCHRRENPTVHRGAAEGGPRHLFPCSDHELSPQTLKTKVFSSYVCAYTYIWQRLKNIGLVTGPCGLFATRLVTKSGGLATNPPCDKPIEDHSTLHRDPRQGFVAEGPRQRFVNKGGPRPTPISRHCQIHVYRFRYM